MQTVNPQLTISFDVTHRFENNRESQAMLDIKRDDFSGDCWVILKRLMQGECLTVRQMMIENVTCHLPRRILDLKEQGINISDRWVEQNGKAHHHKEYFMEPAEIARVTQIILQGLKFEKRKAA